ncbi:MAG: glycine/betaine ABC transporter substrate-binding protein [Clostridium sp.]|jgi:osmoprotectant transport system substrate-binding protein|uniref:glycine betaine ABC transporter substrate-binding protein n=1 Tax=Clostridium sp. TaxID=1506 RepID=UPI0025B7AAF1|nr:glycine betaine ABC transporter substrate-binding protein [Clostridium sp.]MCH3963457.1 glycine/betaine ABC transporter substrate-binding protein [Clostridium sp.]MCI1716675.1 glycine/betaine ABC transporter substrate-binding protein [Clostridium sp.]MCI1801141.1 glycine/betaine ABC transporter substrate-binding protein [Clostridium sp.]MCI1814861.1 glycine/betaine ABC transporter substrate-binding protein [Clostridium sp.]MCI1871762.1 glycine/betaine ABC transporter substrate-binding prote
MKKKLKKTILLSLTATFLLTASLTGCGSKSGTTSSDKPTIKVGSKNFTESLVLGELYADALENAGYKVERKLNLSDSVVHSSLVKGEIDLYPEYTGTGLQSILKEQPKFDAKQVYDEVSKKYKEKFNLIWLDPSSGNDSEGLVITKKASDKYNIHTISDLQKNAGKLRYASQGEFDVRADGMPRLTKVYGPFNFKDKKIYDNGIKYDVLHNDKADVAVAYTTEGQLRKDEFVVLKDDKQAWPPYNVAPVVRKDILDKNPEIKDILNKVTAKLDDKTLIELNAKVDIDKEEYATVAKDYFDKEFGK